MSSINVLLNAFPGLGLPPTLALPLPADTPISSLASALQERLPTHARDLLLYTGIRRPVCTTSDAPLSTFVDDDATLLTLTLAATLRGGKGGFGSQLRAAGGRMSSRKNRNGGIQRDPNASSRNLDGRRLRTVTEAKALAEYLATKPDMDRKEREEKRARWEAIVEAAERRDEEIKNGKKNLRLDGEWVEKKEEEEGKTREAVLAMMREMLDGEGPTGSESEEEGEEGSDEMDVEGEGSASASASSDGAGDAGARSFFGWDEEELSEDEDENEAPAAKQEAAATAAPTYKGKGKARA